MPQAVQLSLIRQTSNSVVYPLDVYADGRIS